MVVIPNSFASGTIAKSSEVNDNFSTVADAIRPTFVFTVSDLLLVDTNVTPALIINNSLTIEKIYAYVKTAPTGANIIIDINKNGTSIWNVTPANRLNITAGTQTGSQTSFDTSSLAEEDILTLDIDQRGSGTYGSDLTLEIRCS